MSNNNLLEQVKKKGRAQSGEKKINSLLDSRPLKTTYFSPVKNKVFNRPKTILIEKERLYDENLQLKVLSNTLIEENMKLKTRLQQSENSFRKNEKFIEKEGKSSGIVNALRGNIKELKERIEKLRKENDELKASVKATRVVELEEEAKQYFNEC